MAKVLSCYFFTTLIKPKKAVLQCGRLSVIRENVVEPDYPKNVGNHPNLDWQPHPIVLLISVFKKYSGVVDLDQQ